MPSIASHFIRAAAALWLAAVSVSPATAAIAPWQPALADRAAPSGTEHIVHAFDGATRDGSHSTALPLLIGSSAFLTTQNGGLNSDFGVGGYGTVVELSRTGFAWPERVIYAFKSGNDGANPAGGVIADRAGNLYGTASLGGRGFPNGGTVFELSRAGSAWKETTLHEFGLTAGDGGYPQGALLEDAAGDFFGTTEYGGGGSLCNYGCGTIFELEPVDGGRAYREVIVHRFTGGNDGAYPVAALITDSTGALYGTASGGGPYGQGVIFKILAPAGKRSWTFYPIRYLTGGADGSSPECTLARASNGVLFGTTNSGGYGAAGGSGGYGVVFSLTPETGSPVRYGYRVLHAFTAGNDGLDPVAGVTVGKGGILYGTTGSNPGGNLGTVFELVPPSYRHYVLYTSNVDVDGLSGLDGGVAIDPYGDLIGAAVHGPGIGQAGFVFDVVPKQ